MTRFTMHLLLALAAALILSACGGAEPIEPTVDLEELGIVDATATNLLGPTSESPTDPPDEPTATAVSGGASQPETEEDPTAPAATPPTSTPATTAPSGGGGTPIPTATLEPGTGGSVSDEEDTPPSPTPSDGGVVPPTSPPSSGSGGSTEATAQPATGSAPPLSPDRSGPQNALTTEEQAAQAAAGATYSGTRCRIDVSTFECSCIQDSAVATASFGDSNNLSLTLSTAGNTVTYALTRLGINSWVGSLVATQGATFETLIVFTGAGFDQQTTATFGGGEQVICVNNWRR